MNKAAFLDRDGTINVDKGYLYRIQDFQYLPGALSGMRQLQASGYRLVIISNQSGIGRGYYTQEDYHLLNTWLLSDLLEKGITVSGSYYCPHHPQAKLAKYRKVCDCRKPATGLFYKAAKDLDIDLNSSIAIGDRLRDLSICLETEASGFLLAKEKMALAGKMILCRSWKELIKQVQKLV